MSVQLKTQWIEKLKFSAEDGLHRIDMDAKGPMGTDSAMTPKQLVVAGLCGCTAMDIVSLLKKYKQDLKTFEISAAVETTTTHPMVFSQIQMEFKLNGTLDTSKVLEAITLSQTKFCGVSAMLSKAVPILYTVFVNNENIGSGRADFGAY